MRSVVMCVALACLAGAADAANLVDEPGFDTDTGDWMPVVGTQIQWSPTDQRGSAASGSIAFRAINAGATEVGIIQCLPASAGTTYAFGAGARIVPGQELLDPRVRVIIAWSPAAACNPETGAAELGATEVTIVGSWGTVQAWATAPPGTNSVDFLVAAQAAANDGSQFRVNVDDAFFLEDARCGATPTTLCLNDDRFRVDVEWETNMGARGYGHAVPLTDDSGYFWFFNDANVELVTKLLDACDTQFDTFWFFAAGLTNVETTIRVHDTRTNTGKVYLNPQETPFAPIQDTDAFHTCPMLGG